MSTCGVLSTVACRGQTCKRAKCSVFVLAQAKDEILEEGGPDLQLQLLSQDFAERAVSPFLELGAYESLWDEQSASFKSMTFFPSRRARCRQISLSVPEPHRTRTMCIPG
jgi:hypothetical protein